MAKENPLKFEIELWDLLNAGDSKQCPLYEYHRDNGRRGWCIHDYGIDNTQLTYCGGLPLEECHFVKSEGQKLCKLLSLIESLAYKYLEQADIKEPPVPNDIISIFDQEHPIEIQQFPLKVNYGSISFLDNSWIIQINSNDKTYTKRHTLFHEAFHILAHCKSRARFQNRLNEAGYFNEILADYFSTCILMPRKWLVEKWAIDNDLYLLRTIFQVPKKVMFIRLRQLGLTNQPCLLE